MSDFSSMFRLDGCVALAASGIGLAAAQGLAPAGALVICDGLDAGGAGKAPVLDYTGGAAVDAAFHEMERRRSQIHVAITTPAIKEVVQVNLTGSFHAAQASGRRMQAKKAGSIILFSSIRPVTVEPRQAAYATAKAGLLQMERGLASELGPAGVRVNCNAPGVVKTPLAAAVDRFTPPV